MSALLPRRAIAPVAALLLCLLVGGTVWACGGSTDSPDPTATQAPPATTAPAPDPTSAPDDTDDSDSGASEEPDTSPPGARDWNVLGSPDAMVTVLDYSDFQ